MSPITDLEGRSFGPHPLRICLEKVREFNIATGTPPERWSEAAPPAFLATALFVVAPELLGEMDGYSVIHGEQGYVWNGPLTMEKDVTVGGQVSRVRERGGTHFVSFDLEVTDADGGVLAGGSSLFLVGASGDEESDGGGSPRTAPDDRGSPSGSQRAASRADLVRYAAATRDWNPIHWDHGAATRAGLDGVITHGLLQASWALDAAADSTTGLRPFSQARIRFRSPLPPATPVDVAVASEGESRTVDLSDGATTYLSARVEVADE